jgi:hypothetical protein
MIIFGGGVVTVVGNAEQLPLWVIVLIHHSPKPKHKENPPKPKHCENEGLGFPTISKELYILKLRNFWQFLGIETLEKCHLWKMLHVIKAARKNFPLKNQNTQKIQNISRTKKSRASPEISPNQPLSPQLKGIAQDNHLIGPFHHHQWNTTKNVHKLKIIFGQENIEIHQNCWGFGLNVEVKETNKHTRLDLASTPIDGFAACIL